jgi:hypothetical protein
MTRSKRSLIDWLVEQYEARKVYRANPCDFDSWGPLRVWGLALARLSAPCSCCNGGRMVAAAVGGAWLGVLLGPLGVVWAALVLLAYAMTAELMSEDEPEDEPDRDEIGADGRDLSGRNADSEVDYSVEAWHREHSPEAQARRAQANPPPPDVPTSYGGSN